MNLQKRCDRVSKGDTSPSFGRCTPAACLEKTAALESGGCRVDHIAPLWPQRHTRGSSCTDSACAAWQGGGDSVPRPLTGAFPATNGASSEPLMCIFPFLSTNIGLPTYTHSLKMAGEGRFSVFSTYCPQPQIPFCRSYNHYISCSPFQLNISPGPSLFLPEDVIHLSYTVCLQHACPNFTCRHRGQVIFGWQRSPRHITSCGNIDKDAEAGIGNIEIEW